jgi:antitoxin (DNA-binding transcriptional repressor) of toxin-antitoxin stability system
VKIESLRGVKANLSKIVKELPSEGSVVITKNGRTCAVLFPVTEETDPESMVLAQIMSSGDSWTALTKKEKKKGLPNSRICLIRGRDRVPPDKILNEEFLKRRADGKRARESDRAGKVFQNVGGILDGPANDLRPA